MTAQNEEFEQYWKYKCLSDAGLSIGKSLAHEIWQAAIAPGEQERKQLADLVLELAEAVDNAFEDIGGCRSQLDILREAVIIAQSIKGEKYV